MEKQTPEEMREKIDQMIACSKGDQIINEIDTLIQDRTQPVQEKLHRITRIMNDFKLARSKVIDEVASIRYQGEVYSFPLWKADNIITYCEVRLDELKTPSAKKYTNRAYGVALILACKANKIHSRNWYQKDLKEIASKVFDDIGNPLRAVRVAIDNESKLASLKNRYPDDYEDGEELFKTCRSRFETILPKN